MEIWSEDNHQTRVTNVFETFRFHVNPCSSENMSLLIEYYNSAMVCQSSQMTAKGLVQ